MDLISEKNVKIRKNHICGMCLRNFQIGTKMYCQVIVDSGEIYSFYICKTCEGLIHYMDIEEYPEGYPEGCVQEEINQYYSGKTPEEYLKYLKINE